MLFYSQFLEYHSWVAACRRGRALGGKCVLRGRPGAGAVPPRLACREIVLDMQASTGIDESRTFGGWRWTFLS